MLQTAKAGGKYLLLLVLSIGLAVGLMVVPRAPGAWATPDAKPVYTETMGSANTTICSNSNTDGGVSDGQLPTCGGQTHVGSSPNYGGYWQCVEFAQRFYQNEGWHSGLFPSVAVAADIWTSAVKTVANGGMGMSEQANNSITSIVPGDMIVHGTTDKYSMGAGHVAIVDHISGSTVYAVQQNAPDAATYSLNGGTLTGGSGTDILGIVHSPNNTNTASGGGSGSASGTSDVATIATSDGHIQTFEVSNGVLIENWYSNSGTPTTTGAWEQSPAMPSTPTGTPAVAVQPSNSSLVNVFVQGTNNQVYETWYNWTNGNWGGWTGMGGGPESFTVSPTVQVSSDGNEQVFGTGGGYVEQNWFNPTNSTYGGWTTSPSLSASAIGIPAVVSRSSQPVMDMFVRANNNQVYETWYNYSNASWGGWIGMGGGPESITGNPQAIATSDGHVQVFGTGGGYIEQNWYNPANGNIGGWTTSPGLSASAIGTPALEPPQSGTNQIDAFVRANNNQVYETWYNFGNGNWGGWASMGGGPYSFKSDPATVATSDGNYQVFGTGGGYVEQNWFNPGNNAIGGWIAY